MAHVRKGKRRGKRVWVVDYVDANGERHRVQRTTREKAESFLAEEIQKAKEAGPVVDNPEITLTEYRERWARRAEQELKPRTFLSYQYYFKRYVEPDLGRLKVRSINRGTVRDLLASRRGSGLAKDTVRLARAALSVVLSSAVDDGLLPSNPALGFRQARADRQSEQEKTERIRPFTEEELGTFLGVAEKLEPRCAPYFWALAHAGLRPGEGLGLQADDLDFDKRLLPIERAISDGEVGSTKTGQRRTVDLSRALERRLRSHLRWRKEEKLARGWPEMPSWLFFTTTGTPLDIHNTAKAFKRCLKEAGIESPHSPYDLRHGFATHLLAKGAPLTYVAAQLGHRKPTTTLRHYAHWMPSNDRRFTDLLGDPWHHFGTKSPSAAEEGAQAPDNTERARGESNTRPTDSKSCLAPRLCA